MNVTITESLKVSHQSYHQFYMNRSKKKKLLAHEAVNNIDITYKKNFRGNMNTF